MINNELLEEVIFISFKNKFIDKKLIRKIIIDTIEKTDNLTKKRFNDVYFEKTDWNGGTVCSCTNIGEIIIDYKKLIKEIKSIKKISYLERNLEIIVNLLHEIEHLKEPTKIKNNNFESFILSLSNLEIFRVLAEEKLELIQNILPIEIYNKKTEKQQEKIYFKIYDKIPSERLATIKAHKLLFESLNNLEKFKIENENGFKYINKKYINQYYMGYKLNRNTKKFNIPLVEYFEFIKLIDLLKEYDFYSSDYYKFLKLSSDEFSIEERMLYGLPVTLKETKVLSKKLTK